MTEENYQIELAKLKKDWGRMSASPQNPGILRADNDITTGLLVGQRAEIIGEIINRALGAI